MIEKDGLIVCLDDDVGVLKRTERLLRFEGFSDVVLCEHAQDIWPLLKERRAVALVLDLLMPDADGYEVLAAMRREHPEVPVIVATALDDLDAVVRCMKAGAFDYVPKSAESTRLIASIEHAALIGSLQDYNKSLRDTLLAGDRALPGYFSAIVTRDSRMLAIFRYIEAIATSDKAILLTGESGTGKELFAAAIHAASGRRGPLVSLNIAGLDDTMFSDTLFGHKRGAFTGADGDRPGLIERASGGTLFLDEIGDLSPQSQVKLLRLIEQRLYYPLGADLTRSSDALIVAATNRNVEAMAAGGSFRQDLFYRLGTHRIHIPPLRERPDDLALLVERFVEQAAGKFAKKKPAVPPELYDLLGAYDFPGNVRELESMIHDAVGRSDTPVLALSSFRDKIFKQGAPARQTQKRSLNAFAAFPVLPSLKEASEELIREALRRAGGNQGVAAALLGISRSALNRRIKSGYACDD
jgi:DNA-binding NtrC family response regulator